MRFVRIASWLLLALFTLVATDADAQGRSAPVAATADVGFPALAFADNDLTFGNILPGAAKTVAPTAATAGQFRVVFFANLHVNISFSLPPVLSGPGGKTLPIGSWTGLWNTANATAGATAFTPSAAATTIVIPGSNTSYVWIGGRVTPGGAQAAGLYSGSITLTAVYAGF